MKLQVLSIVAVLVSFAIPIEKASGESPGGSIPQWIKSEKIRASYSSQWNSEQLPAKLDPLRVRVVMPMQSFGQPKLGMSAAVTSEIQPGKVYAAKVSGIDRIVDAASGTFVVFLDLPNPELDMPSGVKCKAVFGATSH